MLRRELRNGREGTAFSRAEKTSSSVISSERGTCFVHEPAIPPRCASRNDKRRGRKLGRDRAYSTISKRYSSITGLVSTSLEIFSNCCCASSRDQPSRFSTKNFPWRTSVI